MGGFGAGETEAGAEAAPRALPDHVVERGGLVRAEERSAPAHRMPRAACQGESLDFKVNSCGLIFEGKVKSRSSVDNAGMYNVTFELNRVLKGDQSDLDNQRQVVRMQFLDKAASPMAAPGGGVEGCQGVGKVVRANIRPGRPSRRYFLFVDRVAPHVFRPRAEPFIKTKQTVPQMKEALACRGLKLKLKSTTVEVHSRLRLSCAVKPPRTDRAGLTITWFKNGMLLERNKDHRVRITKKGRLEIQSARLEDAGEYSCRAERAKHRCAEANATVQVEPFTTLTGITTKCDHHLESICLNGGTCRFTLTIQDWFCICADGYKGQRCDKKDVNSGSMYKPYICKLGLFTSYYC